MRLVRNTFESATDKIPRGPLGFIGGGNTVGAANYFVVALINGIIPIDGVDVGFDVQSHSVERRDGVEVHTFEINSYNKDVAEFLSRFRAAPSNVDFITEETEIVSIEPIKERSTVTTWRVVAEVKERNIDEIRTR